MNDRLPIHAARGTQLTARSWQTEAPLRMLMNNLDPENAERPEDLVVYGGTGKAARNWESYDALVRTLTTLGDDETMLVQSGKPVGVMKTNEWAPRVLIANSNLVPDWANWEEFRRLEELGLTMYGQMTAGSWIYIGTQGILQGTFETFAAVADKRFEGTLKRTGRSCAVGLMTVGPVYVLTTPFVTSCMYAYSPGASTRSRFCCRSSMGRIGYHSRPRIGQSSRSPPTMMRKPRTSNAIPARIICGIVTLPVP